MIMDSFGRVDRMNEEQFVDTKEMIASIIFDYHNEDGEYIPPHEEDCHAIAEDIMSALGFSEPNHSESDPMEDR